MSETGALNRFGPSAAQTPGRTVRAEPSTGRAATARRSIILEADDLGLLYAFNEGIRESFQRGSLTSACLRANGYAFQHAINEVLPDCPHLAVGVHLCLNEADPVAARERVGPLLNYDGRLRAGFAWLRRIARAPRGMEAIEHEL